MNASPKAQQDFDEILKPSWAESATLHYSNSRHDAQITLDAFRSSCTPLVRRPDYVGLTYDGSAVSGTPPFDVYDFIRLSEP